MTENRIIARLHDGLGNQLFIYAAARAMAAARGATLLVDTRSGFVHDKRYGATAQLHHFAIRAETAPLALSYPPPLGRQCKDLQVSLSAHLPLRHRFVIRESDYEAVCAGAPLRGLVRIAGYWQSERYFAPVANIIREEFRIVSPLSQRSREVAAEIDASAAVCLHVRQMHGAHHAFDKAPPVHVTQLPFSFYEEAIGRIVERVPDAVFFCFADNFDGIKSAWRFPYPIRYVDHNRGSDRAYEDLALMQRCKHFIIGNSTFSWWGAWLADNSNKFGPDKIVIAPDNRGRIKWGSEPDLFPQGWIVLTIA